MTKSASRLVLSVFLSGARRIGPDRVPRRGGCVLALRHVHELDGFLVDASTSRPLDALADPRVAGVSLAALPRVGEALAELGVHIFDRDLPAARSRALRKAVRLVRAGRALALAPEGSALHERKRPGTLRDYYRSIGFLGALREWFRPPVHGEVDAPVLEPGLRLVARGVPIVPIGIAYGAGRGDPRRRAVVVHGEPCGPDGLASRLVALSDEAARALAGR